MPSYDTANSYQEDARIEIRRIVDSTNESVTLQQVAYASGYIRALCDQQLISVGQWQGLTNEIEAARLSWMARPTATQAAMQASAQIEFDSAEKGHS